MGTVITGAAVVGVVCLIIRSMIKAKRKGKSGCGGNCGHCGGSCH